MANYTILKAIFQNDSIPDTLIASIDGEKVQDLSQFYETLGKIFKFPDYAENNLDSFDELINDLEWLNEEEILIILKNYDLLLSEESLETKEVILSIFDDAAEEWKHRDDVQKNIKILIEPSEEAIEDLSEIGIEFEEQ
ncbi:Barstar (barnase inhibitor) [Pseudarcicella hirudinis]|uniref:Barstar (Barnase inhibitor) n=1 Tax=Pseudarcicella hirudinis TaxID=1079859 RepID=A0A1I5WC43_9BACT|nr:barstar family protein [Pseudarcicella hirudinis]SFQ17245.1 Barstar (barnase inhibitor) [Pseudarcicella hirudinis]